MLKVAIIGTGVISSSHIKSYLTFKDRCEVVAICDIYPEKAKEQAIQSGLSNVSIYNDYKDVLQQDIDLVSICTPPFTHAGLAIDFLLAGKHVIVEKPMAPALEECDQMIEAAFRSGKLLSVVAQNRFKNPIHKLKQTLDSGLIGKVLHAQIDSFWWRGHSYYDLWWRGTWEKEGGGCTVNHAVHHIDMLQWMMGMPSEITAVMSNTAHDNAEVEDLSVAILKYANGAIGQITSSVVHHGEEQQLIFQGSHARISAPWKVKASKSRDNGFPLPYPELEATIQQYYDDVPDVEFEGHTGQIHDVLTAIENGDRLHISGVDGRNTIELITAIYKAASTGNKVTLPLQKDDPFYTSEGIQANATHFYEKKKSVENF